MSDKSYIIARFFFSEMNKNINSTAIMGVNFNAVSELPVDEKTPKFDSYSAFRDIKDISIASTVHLNDVAMAKPSDITDVRSEKALLLNGMDKDDRCIKINMHTFPNLAEVTRVQKCATSLSKKINKIQSTEGDAKSFAAYLTYALRALKVKGIYAESFSEGKNKSQWKLYKLADINDLVNENLDLLIDHMKWA
jgi:hypothetical protein